MSEYVFLLTNNLFCLDIRQELYQNFAKKIRMKQLKMNHLKKKYGTPLIKEKSG